jgi:hypothetical protein
MKAGMESFILGAGLATIGRYEYLRCIVGEVEDDRRGKEKGSARIRVNQATSSDMLELSWDPWSVHEEKNHSYGSGTRGCVRNI